ncbi:MAG: ABC transporter substrate-binding protein [Syntrophomonadaceae bacterium]|jgi:iron(III) transport system substrate-binding protein|nr:ABC transporter substrate-binding protein [Syntrophomonadaceae bacterium]
MKKNQSMKACLFLLVGLLALIMLSGCAKKAAAGGKLVIYSPNSETLVSAIIPAFEKASGVTVDLISAGTGECWKRIESEKNNPIADVIWGGQVQNSNPALLEAYVSVNDGSVLPQFRNIDGALTKYCLDGSVLLVNTELIGNINVEGYADLLNPALKGKLIMGDPTNSSSAFAQLSNILYDMGGGDYFSAAGWDYVRSLLLQLDGKIAQSSSGVHKGVADGEYTVGLTYEDPSASYVRDGAPVKIVYMKEGVSFLPATSGIIKNCKNMENAKKFMDFITSKEAQDIIGTQLTVRPVRDDAELGSYMTPFSEIRMIEEDSDELGSVKSGIIERYRNLVTSLQ